MTYGMPLCLLSLLLLLMLTDADERGTERKLTTPATVALFVAEPVT